ncbi:MAG: BamA/TamA family outer membrane protein [Candidatus Cyclobacteriaceae bacterium M2_1C_046]
MFFRYNYTILILLLFLLSSCVGTRYLKEDEKLLYKQQIKSTDKVSESALEELYVQKPNRQLPLVPFSPYVWFYQVGKNKFDEEKYRQRIADTREKFDEKIANAEKEKRAIKLEAKKNRKIQKTERKLEEGNVLMNWGEPLARYDTSATEQTVRNMELYLKSKGFFQGEVKTSTKVNGDKLKLTYHIQEGPPYIIDTVFYKIPDPTIQKLIKNHEDQSLLNSGVNYDQEILIGERERLTNLLKDNGYYAFSKSYIDFDVDTAYIESQQVAVRTTIKNPSGKDQHPIYRIKHINFIADSDTRIPDSLRKVVEYEGTDFRAFDFDYSPKILHRRIFIRKDSLYNHSATINTQRQLANLDNFKFINVAYDTLGTNLTANILVSPLSRFQWSNEFGVNVTQGYPGPFYNLSFKKRNVFGGLENFNINARIGIEGVAQASNDDLYKSTEAGVNASLIFPQFILPISNDLKEKMGQINPRTRLSGGYAYTSRPEYNRKNTNFSAIYSWENGRNILYSFAAADISLINSSLDSAFQGRLETLRRTAGNNLINSFNPSFVSSMNFAVTINSNNYGIGFSNSRFFRLFLESGGTSLNFLGSDFFDTDEENGSRGLEYYKFLKFSGDYRKSHTVNKKSAIAYRLNLGFALPYSDNEILPYEKYFFAGGSSGIRAWRPRRLGPGSYTPIDTTGSFPVVSYDFEQQGEILFEGSVEWRQNLIGFIDYALFADFGNIWTFNRDPSREGAQFELDRFYKEIAVGSGMGLRFDFSFLILRLDAGVKIYDPARPEGKRFILSDGFYDAPFIRSKAETLVFNIGIGYPF